MPADYASPRLGWDLFRDVSLVLEYHFMVNALLAGSIVAVVAGVVGWLMVLRGETFAGHTLAMMSFPGASAAALAGVPAAWGYFAFCGAGALAIAGVPGAERHSWRERTASTGAVQALALAAGFLLLNLYGGVLGDLETLLFGDLLGISDARVLALLALGAASLCALAAVARPLLFASLDPDVAAARGVPVRALSVAFLLVLGLTVAATSQITGVLLVFALLVTPAATAQALTSRPAASLLVTIALGLLIVWIGLGISYFSVYPAGFFITMTAFAFYVLARALAAARRGRRRGEHAVALQEAPPEGVIV
jgi:zinc/manganese transport system permease protein